MKKLIPVLALSFAACSTTATKPLTCDADRPLAVTSLDKSYCCAEAQNFNMFSHCKNQKHENVEFLYTGAVPVEVKSLMYDLAISVKDAVKEE